VQHEEWDAEHRDRVFRPELTPIGVHVEPLREAAGGEHGQLGGFRVDVGQVVPGLRGGAAAVTYPDVTGYRAAAGAESAARRRYRRNAMIARSKAAATCCWKAADVSIRASPGFFMFPTSIRTLGTVVRFSPARSSRSLMPLAPS
jgi:hypothetical protein